MSFKVLVRPSGLQFFAEPTENILDASLRAGAGMPFGCKDGACGSCKARVLAGELEQGWHAAPALSHEEHVAGLALLCCAQPRSDLEIEVREVAGYGEFPARKMPCRITHLERVTPDVVIVALQLPAAEHLRYRAGQFLEFTIGAGVRRCYSIATAPHVDEAISIHVRHMPGGVFTDALFGAAAKPIKAIAETIFHLQLNHDDPGRTRPARSVALYWGARARRDLYMNDLPMRWAGEQPNFRYIPVLSDALEEDAWTGRTGFVHQAVMQDLPDLSQHEVYACGAPAMVEAARRDFVHLCGLPDDHFLADAFTSKADVVKD